MRNKELLQQVADWSGKEMRCNPGVSETAALEILHTTAVWLTEWYKYCDDPQNYPKPSYHTSFFAKAHELL